MIPIMLTHIHRFEAQLAQVKDRLEMAKQSSIKSASSPSQGGSGFSFGGAGSRIAKPLRGGGPLDQGGGGGGPNLRFISSLQGHETNGGSPSSGKRSSWFFKNNG